MGKMHLSLRVSDPKRSMEFYRNLGFELRSEERVEKFGTTLVFLTLGPEFELELVHNWNNPDKPELKDGFLHIGIEVDDLEKFLARLRAAGIQPLCPVSILPNGKKLCFVIDPDGYQVELLEPGRK
jgi:lactoylglutathione lyase